MAISEKSSFKQVTIVVTLLLWSMFSFSQVSVNTTGNDPDNSAMLDVSSNTKGLLIPRMSTSERDQIQQPAEGLIIFNTTNNSLNFYSGQVWYTVSKVNLCSPVINSQPVDAEACIGDNISFQVTADGDGKTYRWQEDQGNGFSDISDGGVYSGSNTNTLQLSGIQSSMNNYLYRCIVSGTCPPADTSGTALLTVDQPAQITANPSDESVCEMQQALFYISATGSNLTYQWQEDAGSGFANVNYQGYNTHTLNVDVFIGMSGYKYRCIVSDNCSNVVTSGSATLTVLQFAFIYSQPQNQTVSAGGNTSFSITVDGDVISYQWEVNDGNGFTPVSDGGVYSGAFTATLNITGATTSMNGYSYRCTIYGYCSAEVSAPAQLTVN